MFSLIHCWSLYSLCFLLHSMVTLPPRVYMSISADLAHVKSCSFPLEICRVWETPAGARYSVLHYCLLDIAISGDVALWIPGDILRMLWDWTQWKTSLWGHHSWETWYMRLEQSKQILPTCGCFCPCEPHCTSQQRHQKRCLGKPWAEIRIQALLSFLWSSNEFDKNLHYHERNSHIYVCCEVATCACLWWVPAGLL